jgi:hypothetical protein
MSKIKKEMPIQTPMQEFISHLKSVLVNVNIDETFWLKKEKKEIVTAYNEGIEDDGLFGNGNDYFDRNY